MRMKKILLTALLACLVLLGGCSRPASDHPDDNEDPSPVTENQEEESSETPQEETDDSPSDETSSEKNEEDQKCLFLQKEYFCLRYNREGKQRRRSERGKRGRRIQGRIVRLRKSGRQFFSGMLQNF